MIIKGITAQITRTITEKDTAEKVRSGSLPVLATPVLSAAMEEAACKALAPHLTEGETTVGGSISLIHKAPTLPGHTITVTATVTEVKGKMLTYSVKAYDEVDKICEGTHGRAIIELDKFLSRVNKKGTK